MNQNDKVTIRNLLTHDDLATVYQGLELLQPLVKTEEDLYSFFDTQGFGSVRFLGMF